MLNLAVDNAERNPLERKGKWSRTFLGNRYWTVDPRPEDVHIEDIAHALSLQCRFNGMCRRFLSVAEHCWIASQIVPAAYSLDALLHDASEAYHGDMVRPLKYEPEMTYFRDVVEPMNEKVIAAKFPVAFPIMPAVKYADEAVVTTEIRQNLTNGTADNRVPWDVIDDPRVKLRYWSPRKAERKFLQRYNYLTGAKISIWHLYLPYWLSALFGRT